MENMTATPEMIANWANVEAANEQKETTAMVSDVRGRLTAALAKLETANVRLSDPQVEEVCRALWETLVVIG